MIAPAQLIAELDAGLAEAGGRVTVRRYTAPGGTPRPKTDIDGVPATVRPVRPDELVGDIDQAWSTVVLSPTAIAALLPLKKNDKIVLQGKELNIEFPKPIYVQNTLVRIDAVVSG